MPCLANYLRDPWKHALHVVPLAASLDKRIQMPLRRSNLSEGLRAHLWSSLRQWSALRGRDEFKSVWRRFERHLPAFVRDLQKLHPATRLSRIPARDIEQYARDLETTLTSFSSHVKRTSSVVIAAKTAHLLLPTLVPAYDQEVVAGTILPRVLPRGRRDFHHYVLACWWVLAELKRTKRLPDALGRVAKHLSADWAIRQLAPGSNIAARGAMPYLDSVVAEYVLTGMAYARNAYRLRL